MLNLRVGVDNLNQIKFWKVKMSMLFNDSFTHRTLPFFDSPGSSC